MSERKAEFARRLGSRQAQLSAYIFSLVHDLNDADDLFQQTCLVLWDKYDRYDPSKSFIGWACSVARFEVSNFLRSQGRRRLSFGDETSLLLIETHVELERERLDERREALGACVGKLRRRDQDLLEAYYGGSARISEISRAWGRSTQSIHNSLRRIRRTLFECVRRALARGGVA